MTDIFTLEYIKSLERRIELLETREHSHAFIGTGTPTSVVISGGVINIVRGCSSYLVDCEGGGATDDLDTINGGILGDIIIIQAQSLARDIVCKDGTGNLRLPADMTLDNTEDIEMLYFDGTNWCEITASSNV